jgi:hypothetical protein
MTLTEDKTEFMEATLETCFGSICVKKRGKTMQELFDDPHGHGILVRPVVERGPAADVALKQTMQLFHPVVVVRGHGWDFETPFVWTGTSDEFKETWVID